MVTNDLHYEIRSFFLGFWVNRKHCLCDFLSLNKRSRSQAFRIIPKTEYFRFFFKMTGAEDGGHFYKLYLVYSFGPTV